MKAVLGYGAFWLAFFGGAFLYWNYVDRQTNRLLPLFAGCFQGDGALARTQLIVAANGRVQLYGETLLTRLTKDKEGYSFVPSRAILFETKSPARLVTASSPLLLRFSPDRQHLTIPGDGPGAILHRVGCSPTAQR